jgi:hypothetical protein
VPVEVLATAGDTLYAAGSYYYASAGYSQELPMGYVAAWNGGIWSVVGQGFEAVNIHALAADTAGNVYIAGEQPATPESGNPIDAFIAQWDGENWSQIGASLPGGCLSSNQLAVEQGGGVFAACTVNAPGESIAHWDGSSWTTLSDQLEGEAPAIFAMAADRKGGLYIGGDFTAVSGVPASRIAYWDGRAWQALGEGVNEQALVVDPDGILEAAGWFSEAGGQSVEHIARWDGETWQALVP